MRNGRTSSSVLMRCLVPAALIGASLAACSSDNGGGSTTPTLPASATYFGLLVGNDGSTSTLSLVFNSAVSLQADGSGRMTILSRPPVDFTGTITGAVPGDLTGTLDNGVFTATGLPACASSVQPPRNPTTLPVAINILSLR